MCNKREIIHQRFVLTCQLRHHGLMWRICDWYPHPMYVDIQCGAVITRSIFSQIFHKIHPKARPLRRGMGCLLWIQHLIDILPQFLQLLFWYLTILDRLITAFDCISYPKSINVYPNQHIHMAPHIRGNLICRSNQEPKSNVSVMFVLCCIQGWF